MDTIFRSMYSFCKEQTEYVEVVSEHQAAKVVFMRIGQAQEESIEAGASEGASIVNGLGLCG